MTSLQTSITTLISSIEKSGIEADFVSCPLGQLNTIAAKLPLSQELRLWYQTAAPQDISIPWTVEWLYLYSPNSLVVCQDGYRWPREQRDQLLDGWNPNWIVIGDASANPVIAHVDQSHTPISMDYHGMGEWTPKRIAPSLASFLHILAIWVDISIGKYKGEIRNEDGEMHSQAISDVDAALTSVLDNEYKSNFLFFTE